MKILFVGFVPPYYMLNKVMEWGSRNDIAGYTFQTSLLNGLDAVCEDLRVVSTLWMSTYPKAKRIYLPRTLFSHNSNEEKRDVFIGFINLPFLKRFSMALRFYKELRRLSKNDHDLVLVNYALSSSSLLPIFFLRKRFREVCQIVPDLPEFMSARKDKMYKLGKFLDIKIINHCLDRVDKFVLLSPYMREKLPIKSKPWIQLEGIYNHKDLDQMVQMNCEGKKVVMYSGMLGLRYGIGDLVEAFTKIQGSEYELWLCGHGNACEMIARHSKEDQRIKYFGVLERDVVLAMQRQASVLVNPRHKSELYTRYSFPSKTMEFLASGTPVIMSHLECIPKEYDEFIYYFDDESIQGMKDKIESVCNKPKEELAEFGRKASNFILSQKNSYVQAKRLYDFLNDNA